MTLSSIKKRILAAIRTLGMRLISWLTYKPLTAEADFSHSLLVPRRMFDIHDRQYWESECRRMSLYARLKDDEILCRTLGRYRMIVNARDEGLAPNLIADGFWEIWISSLIARFVQPGMVCIDAGANIGYYTLLMADQAGSKGKCIAAEPVPDTFKYLKKNAQLNDSGHVELLNLAFGAEAGEATLLMPRGEPKNAAMTELLHPDESLFDVIKAKVCTIDSLELPCLDFIKIDVEGAEHLVWRGMQATIARSPNIQIVMEVNAHRDYDIDNLLAEISAIFPLQGVDYWGDPTPLTVEQIKADPYDVMLYLSKRTPSEIFAPPTIVPAPRAA